jgi:hypothetical protein
MKTFTRLTGRNSVLTLATAFLLHASNLPAGAVEEKLEQQFPDVIQYELGASGFAPGDQITITSVRGDRTHIEPGGSYLVEGTYTLASAESADLALFCTSRGPSGPTPIQDGQRIKITKGAGKFRLCETNVADGWLHVSFYPQNGSSHGGVYFGEKGMENTIMRKQEWFHEFTAKSADERHGSRSDPGNKANRALLAYLGDPVPPPANMDSRYGKQNLLKAFTALCRKADLVITKLAVDDSEFPFIVYGTLEGAHTLPDKPLFEDQKGYTYGGSVRGSIGEGSTYFAVNMVPRSQYPEGREKAVNRRLMVRLQMLADKVSQAE